MENKHTYTEYKFPDGGAVKCTVAFRFLLKLREQNKRIYKKVNDCIVNGLGEDLVESAHVLYGAYLCACYAGENGGVDAAMNETEFVERLDDDLVGVLTVCLELINKKKN